MRELSEWLESGDRYSFFMARYLEDEAADNAKVGSRTPDCKLPAADFLRLREGQWLNDSLMDAALNSICELSGGRGTCSVLSWPHPEKPRKSDHVLQRTLCDHAQQDNGKSVLAINDPTVRHWVGIFLDVKCQPVPNSATATIYNPFGAAHVSSGFAADAVRRVLSTTS
jgi:hypothetical protein